MDCNDPLTGFKREEIDEMMNDRLTDRPWIDRGRRQRTKVQTKTNGTRIMK
jgi:hypothetical protein